MKKIAALLILALISIQFLAAQAQSVQQAQPADKTFSWNETTHDFGKIKQNDPAAVTFTVKNNGTAPLIMTAARSSCGCTVAEFTKEPIKPNDTGIIKATYNSARVGPFTKTVTVTYDGITSPDVLTIKGNVEGAPAATAAPAPGTAPAQAPAATPTPEKK
jgi:hypothetical protein